MVDERELESQNPAEQLEQDMDPEHQELLGRLLFIDNVESQIEILAIMNRRGFRPPTHGQ